MKPVEQTFSNAQRIAAATGLGLAGLVTMAAILTVVGDPSSDDGILLLSAFVGAGAASAPFLGLFGRRRLMGGGFFGAGSALATTFGAVYGGLVWAMLSLLVMQVDGAGEMVGQAALLGVVVVWVMIVTQPGVLMAWLIAMIAVHVHTAILRADQL